MTIYELPLLVSPVLVMRDQTEYQEGLDGRVRLVGTGEERILSEADRLLSDESHLLQIAEASNPHGDDTISNQLVQLLEENLRSRSLP